MLKKSKKILFVTLIMIISLLTGCGSKDETEDRAKAVTAFCQNMCSFEFKNLSEIITGKNIESLTDFDIESMFKDDVSKKVFDLLKTKSSQTGIKVASEEKKDDKTYILTVELTYQDLSSVKTSLNEKVKEITDNAKDDASLKGLSISEIQNKLYERVYAEIDKMKEQHFEVKTVSTTISVVKDGGKWKVSDADSSSWKEIVTCGIY